MKMTALLPIMFFFVYLHNFAQNITSYSFQKTKI